MAYLFKQGSTYNLRIILYLPSGKIVTFGPSSTPPAGRESREITVTVTESGYPTNAAFVTGEYQITTLGQNELSVIVYVKLNSGGVQSEKGKVQVRYNAHDPIYDPNHTLHPHLYLSNLGEIQDPSVYLVALVLPNYSSQYNIAHVAFNGSNNTDKKLYVYVEEKQGTQPEVFFNDPHLPIPLSIPIILDPNPLLNQTLTAEVILNGQSQGKTKLFTRDSDDKDL